MMNRDLYLRLRANSILEEIRVIEKQTNLLIRLDEGPIGIFSSWPSGMPRGTNAPVAALLQREDLNAAIDRLDILYEELQQIADEIQYGAA